MSALKKKNWTPLPGPEKKSTKKNESTVDTAAENLAHKAEIDRMKKLLSEKIRDPKMAKKAAMIIADMLEPFKER